MRSFPTRRSSELGGLRPHLPAAALALVRAPADGVAVELAGPGDAGHFGVSALLRVGNAVAQRAHAQHAAAGGDGAVAVQAGAGMEHLGVVHVRHVPGVDHVAGARLAGIAHRSEEHTSELQSLMRISYAVFCLKKKKKNKNTTTATRTHI